MNSQVFIPFLTDRMKEKNAERRTYLDFNPKRLRNDDVIIVPLIKKKTQGGDSHMDQTGMFVGNFEFNP